MADHRTESDRHPEADADGDADDEGGSHRDESEAMENAGEVGGKKKKTKKEVALQDQTHLLPLKQVLLVFVGLSVAIFCSLLDQTM